MDVTKEAMQLNKDQIENQPKRNTTLMKLRTHSKHSENLISQSLQYAAIEYDKTHESSISLTSHNGVTSSAYCDMGGFGENVQQVHTHEALDKIYPLPDGYPRLHNKIFRCRALFFRKPMSSSIKKAVEHLRKLQDCIEEWSREVELEILSRHSESISASSASSQASSDVTSIGYKLSTEARGRRTIRFEDSSYSRLDSVSICGSRAPSTAHSVSTHTMSIQGMGAIIPQGPPIIKEAIPYLGAEEVIEEVFELLGRLETDCVDTAAAYDKEQKRVEWLLGRIDKLAEKRMHVLPKVVQKEHEACATDIAELKWHCSFKDRQLSRVRSQTEVADVLNKRLKEDIAFVKKHCPLVEEKLDLESNAMKRIDEAQKQTTNELNKTIDKFHSTENKSHEAHGKAKMERTHIKKELDGVRDALKQISFELEQAKVMYASHIHTCQDVQEKLKVNAQEKSELETRNDNTRKAEKLKAGIVKQIQDKIVDEEFQHRKLADHNFQLTGQIERMRNGFEKVHSELEGQIKVKLADLRERQEQCREMKMEIEDIEIKLKDCKRQRLADAKNMDRIAKEMKKVGQQLGVVEEEYEKIKVINGAIKNKLIGEEEKTLTTEDNLKSMADTLKKQVKEETHSRTVLQARIASDTADLTKQQVEAKKKKMKVSKKAKEYEEVANSTQKEVQELRNSHAQRIQAIDELETSLSNLMMLHQETEGSLTKIKVDLEPRCKGFQSTTVSVLSTSATEQTQPVSLQEENMKMSKQLDFMAYRMDLINKKLADMAQSSAFMHRVIKTTEEAIADLNIEMEEVTIQLEVGKKQQASMKISLEEVDDRILQGDSRHQEHMMVREEVLIEKEAQLMKHLAINKELAHKYKVVQNNFYKIKNELLDTFEYRVSLESSLKDHKQLNGLQLRLHEALARYYYVRGLYNTNELARFHEISIENLERISTLQQEMDKAIETISKFLTDQLDGTAARMVAAVARSVLTKEINISQGWSETVLKSTKDRLGTLRETSERRKTLVREGAVVSAVNQQQSRISIRT